MSLFDLHLLRAVFMWPRRRTPTIRQRSDRFGAPRNDWTDAKKSFMFEGEKNPPSEKRNKEKLRKNSFRSDSVLLFRIRSHSACSEMADTHPTRKEDLRRDHG
jgi:hypothetical protein